MQLTMAEIALKIITIIIIETIEMWWNVIIDVN